MPATYGGIAMFILSRAFGCQGQTVHLVFDKTLSPSIKDVERDLRSSNKEGSYKRTRPEQKRPSNWLSALRDDGFKEELVELLTSYWKNDCLAAVYGNKTLIANCGDTCYSYFVNNEKVRTAELMDMFSTHEEADSRMMYDVAKLAPPANVVVRTVDTDVLIIALGCIFSLDKNIKIWL